MVEAAARSLISAHRLGHEPCQDYCAQQAPSLSSEPIVAVTVQQVSEALEGFVPHQPYIQELLPFIDSFLTTHKEHFLFLTCDLGAVRPWHFGEPQWYQWREIQAAFNFEGQFLPKNLVKDFGFHHWKEVIRYYSEHESWFLHEQMKDEREALRQAFEQIAIAA